MVDGEPKRQLSFNCSTKTWVDTMIIGLDVGGTHADVVLVGDAGLAREIKVATDPKDLFKTVLTGLEAITAGIDPQQIRRIVLSTTLTTNAIAQRKLPPVGMIVSSGPGLDPEFYRTGPNYYAVSGSIDHRGREVAPVCETEIRQVAEDLKAGGIGTIGIVGKFSIRNPQHEIRIYTLLKDHFERVFMGHQVSGNLNFARRVATTYLNAAVYPIHRSFFDAVTQSLARKGLKVPLYILKADGGTMNLDASMEYPGQTILSGPAASVMGAVAFAPNDADAMVLDIGGTTTDMAIIRNRIPLLHPIGVRVGGYRTLIRSLETRSIGIGGDSVVTVRNGELIIGPEREGPAMAFGGSYPTPTDALFVLGEMNGGDREAAIRGMTLVGRDLDVSIEETARRVFDQACRGILSEARELVDRINSRPVYTVQDLQQGDKFNPRVLLVLGGPAPYFARRLEALSESRVRLVPRWQVANAIGAALARTTCEVMVFADTQRGIVMAPEENFSAKADHNFSRGDAIDQACHLLKIKARQIGAGDEELEMEVLEELQFNMVRGFLTTGRNLRVKVQVKPGLIRHYERFFDGSPA
ncbi:MAG: hydantoinase/oxoprolinase family protein [Desulfobacterales bacterium]